jgi:hypothetical protein
VQARKNKSKGKTQSAKGKSKNPGRKNQGNREVRKSKSKGKTQSAKGKSKNPRPTFTDQCSYYCGFAFCVLRFALHSARRMEKNMSKGKWQS